jgi:hypothetical protein
MADFLFMETLIIFLSTDNQGFDFYAIMKLPFMALFLGILTYIHSILNSYPPEGVNPWIYQHSTSLKKRRKK